MITGVENELTLNVYNVSEIKHKTVSPLFVNKFCPPRYKEPRFLGEDGVDKSSSVSIE